MPEKVSSGSPIINVLLDGGFEKDVITTIYGPAGSGKTNICLFCTIEVTKNGKKVIFIDTEGGFSVKRLEQISKNYKDVLKNMIFLAISKSEAICFPNSLFISYTSFVVPSSSR